jgi:para-nitrobenzyl esterase
MKTNRRNFIQKLGLSATSLGATGLGATGLALGSTITSEAKGFKPKEKEDEQILFVGDNIAVTNTQYGKVRGYILRGIHTFLGIPYGADTSGENRFMPPQKPKSWTDVKPAVWWGNSAPQIMEKRYADQYASFVDHWNYDDVSEDCLKINVWTPALDNKKRPVIVWLHGGGFVNGNAVEQDGYQGENLSRFGDVVFCSLNHRLGALGFTNLAGTDDKMAASGNVGMLDIVAALEWVRDNIANFGGDASNVTIIGQSGGGSKVCTLTAMPSAKGLFHKAVALSGSSLNGLSKEYSEKLGAMVLKEAGLGPNEIGKLQQIPWREYIDIANRAVTKMADEAKRLNLIRGGFAPVADGNFLSVGAFYADNLHFSADVPMIISTTFNEQSPSRVNSALENVTLSEAKANLKARFGDKTSEIVDAYAKAFPDKKPIEIWSMILSNRKGAIATADAKAKQKAPVYVAWFGFQPPLFDGRMRAFHCDDICFWFYNTDLMLTHTGGGARPRRLSEKMAKSFLNFVRTGNPNGGGLPNWSRYSSEKGETMILNDECLLKNDPDREARKALS